MLDPAAMPPQNRGHALFFRQPSNPKINIAKLADKTAKQFARVEFKKAYKKARCSTLSPVTTMDKKAVKCHTNFYCSEVMINGYNGIYTHLLEHGYKGYDLNTYCHNTILVENAFSSRFINYAKFAFLLFQLQK